MKRGILISPQANARLVVTMPPTPSRLAAALEKDIASNYVTFTPTTDAFLHLATIARERLTVMVPYIDKVGAKWAAEVFECTAASERILILRGAEQLESCGLAAARLRSVVTRLIDYGGADPSEETFHAKIVLADGKAAYVGSANLLRRSKTTNLECGMLFEGEAVHAVKVLVEAVASTAISEETQGTQSASE